MGVNPSGSGILSRVIAYCARNWIAGLINAGVKASGVALWLTAAR